MTALTAQHTRALAARALNQGAANQGAADLGKLRARRAKRQADDLRLVDTIASGTPQASNDAFTELVKKYQKPLYWLAYDILLDADEARDVVQEAFVRVHAALHRYDRKRRFVNWIYRIARNLAIDVFRRRARRATSVDDLGYVSNEDGLSAGVGETGGRAQRSDEQSRVHDVLATLPPDYRTALTLREMHGMTPREIAEVIDTSYATARWRLHRARNLFRKAWDERYPPQSHVATSSASSSSETSSSAGETASDAKQGAGA